MNPNTIHVGIYDTWTDWESGYALAHLGSGAWQPNGVKYQIVLVGETNQTITTKSGIKLTPDMTVDQLDPEDSAMLMLPGADTWLGGGNRPFVDAARRFLTAGVPVAAICGATVGLAAGGLLNTLRHTSDAPVFLESQNYSGADLYSGDLAVIDGDLITASGIAPVEFARAIFERLEFYDKTRNENWYLLYGRQDSAGFFGLMDGITSGQ